MERLYHMERHWLANQTVIQLEKTLTDNTDAGTMPSWHDTTANYQTYDIGQIFKHLHDKIKSHIKLSYDKEVSKMSSFKSNENIHKKEDGSYYVVSANKVSSVTL